MEPSVFAKSRSRRSLPGRAALPALLAVTAMLVGMPAHAQDATGRIDSIFAFATAETPGCAVGVAQNGEIVVNRAYGLADVDRRVPLSTRSAFDIGSTHKQMTC